MERTPDLYDRIGAFLAAHRLSADPVHYSFVYAVLTEPDAPLAREVAQLIDGGVRLMPADIERLGGRVAVDIVPPVRERPCYEDDVGRAAERLVAETQAQVDGFSTMVSAMHHETSGFGHDLAQSAAAIVRGEAGGDGRQVARIASAMIERVRDSETRLARATDEAGALRVKLAEARETARRDPLTGLPNRLAFTEAFARRDPAGGPHCIALCDIDRFKRINDKHGHGVGDRVLNAIGQILTASCKTHLVARHGGEEFVVLLEGGDLVAAAAALDDARAAVASKRFRDRENGAALGPITFSAGIVAVRIDEAVEQAIDRADRLLYAAKAQGRDRVCAG